MPRREQKRWQGWIVSLLAHLLLLGLILVPAMQSDFNHQHAEGAGGNGPAGGGGGGANGGADILQERLRFIGLPAPSPALPTARPVVQPPPILQPPKPRPVVQPITPPLSASHALPSAVAPATAAATSPLSGMGAGVGGTGNAGAGPGSGGGTGSGEGTGRGSGTGPGTGGGNAAINPPTPTQFFLPPLPAPRKLHGFHLIAWFDVDSLGKSTLLRFTPSSDNDYNKRLRETLLAVKFRPAVRLLDGVPVRDTVDVQFLF